MRGYLYQLTSSRQLFPRFADWAAYLSARALRKLPATWTPAALRKRTFWVQGLESACVLRPQTQDFSVARELYLHQEYHGIRRSVSPDAGLIVDLGSNIGLSVRLWQQFFPRATIIAVEPDSDNLAICRENIALGPDPKRVRIIEGAVAARRGTLFLAKSNSSLGHRAVADAAAGAPPVQALTMAELLAGFTPDQRIDLLKCDIEGGERELFACCQSWIDRVNVLVVEVHGEYTPSALEDDLRRNGARLRMHHIDARHNNLAIAFLVRDPKLPSSDVSV